MAFFTHEQSAPELWGGVECTVNRVNDDYFDQMERNGHAWRLEDLDLFASLGIKALRYPVLWERTAPDGIDNADWRWADERLNRLRELGIEPIVGFVHHGSGPRDTNLLDPAFPGRLAAYARAFAERYPWVKYYTPVNEPLTTARFSGLYGHWYPHHHSYESMLQALFVQCRAVVESMQAIRAINPDALLVQTEDLAKIFSTPPLAYEADFQNERRWLSFDLLTGRIDSQHTLWDFLLENGQPEADILWFRENACQPDIMGLNYYLSSERFLDHRLEFYPTHTHGGNGRDRYADVESVRVRTLGLNGPKALLRECWDRYHLPMAVTEVHNGCTREEQLRWFMAVWDAAVALRQEGVDLRAVTAWSLLGAYDWHTLVTRMEGHYEPGVFDVSGAQVRPTALASMLRELSEGRRPDHPLMDSPGWWERPQRLIYGVCEPDSGVDQRIEARMEASMESNRLARLKASRTLVILGARGTLGRAFARLCCLRGIPHRLLGREDMDIADEASVKAKLSSLNAWAVVNAAGYVRVDDAETDREHCFRENTLGPSILAQACQELGLQLLTFSSDLVFDGSSEAPYRENDAVMPLNVYGQSKAEAERLVLAHCPSALVIRTSSFFGPWDEYNFVTQALRTLAAGKTFTALEDTTVSPTYVPDLVNACLDLLIDRDSGIWHLSNQGQISWAELARCSAEAAGLSGHGVVGCTLADLNLPAPRPRFSALSSERGILLPSLERSLGRYLAECEVDWRAGMAMSGVNLPGRAAQTS
ncbi:family 1 glycosylhydrolase [Thermithiobacillus plumbiphilus]|uniref:dTDP-4-dehydrorhamnose reductase n=1 Tax=Thermithiobacillus plumbiphilus TaxID=1729899 RepID=A0ABU9D561_9PROT